MLKEHARLLRALAPKVARLGRPTFCSTLHALGLNIFYYSGAAPVALEQVFLTSRTRFVCETAELKVDLKLGTGRAIYFKTSDSNSDSKPSQDNSDLIYISKSHGPT